MALALVDLARVPARPERFADPADPAARVFVDELAPEGDDPRRVAPQVLDVGEEDRLALVAELGLQQLHPRQLDGDQRHFARLPPQPADRA